MATNKQLVQPTAGPWYARETNKAQMNIRTDKDTIATVYCNLGSSVTMTRDGEGDANARLIAKAPELRAALQRAVRELRALQAYGERTFGDAFWPGNDDTYVHALGLDSDWHYEALLAEIDGAEGGG